MSRKPLRHDLPIAIRGGLEEVSTPHAGVAGLIELGRQRARISMIVAGFARFGQSTDQTLRGAERTTGKVVRVALIVRHF